MPDSRDEGAAEVLALLAALPCAHGFAMAGGTSFLTTDRLRCDVLEAFNSGGER